MRFTYKQRGGVEGGDDAQRLEKEGKLFAEDSHIDFVIYLLPLHKAMDFKELCPLCSAIFAHIRARPAPTP